VIESICQYVIPWQPMEVISGYSLYTPIQKSKNAHVKHLALTLSFSICFMQIKGDGKQQLKYDTIKKVYSGSESYFLQSFFCSAVLPAALPLVPCNSTCPPRRVASWENYTAVDELNRPVSTSLVISACWRLMHHDVKISGTRLRTHDLWIRKRVCYSLHQSAPQRPTTWR